MVDQGEKFSFFRDIHIKIDTRVDISISLRPMTTKFGKRLDIEELTNLRLERHVLVTSSPQN